MEKMTYIPQPVDTKGVKLPTELESLVEEMSKNVHEVWAKTRMEQGWTYGERRDDSNKKTSVLDPIRRIERRRERI